jgi:rod shape-determining protein MreC
MTLMATIELTKRPVLVFAGAVVLNVILISAQVTTTAGIPFIQIATFGVFSELQRWTMNGFDSVRGLWTGYVALRDVNAENESLKHELQTLQVRLQEERAQAQRTESLRQLLDLKDRAELQTSAAEIIASGPSPEIRTMTIDKGSSDGLKPDMAVISPAGVVGRVILPSSRAAKVQMLIDRNAAAGALIERTRAQGIVMGQGDTLRMEYVPGTADVQEGDLIVTSGIDGIYPKGFAIGTVETVDRGPGTYHEITVRPAVDFSRLEEVLVVLTPPPAKVAEEDEKRTAAQPKAAAGKNQTPPAPQTPTAERRPGQDPAGDRRE